MSGAGRRGTGRGGVDGGSRLAPPSTPLRGAANLASPVARVCLGVDSGQVAGWGVAHERGPTVVWGTATRHAHRRAAVEAALDLVGGDVRRVIVMMEQHDHMPLDKGMPWDRNRSHAGQAAAPFRSTKTPIGMGKNYGKWLDVFEMLGIPDAHVLEVKPVTWRARYGFKEPTSDLYKKRAVEYVAREVGINLNHNVAEAFLIAEWAAWHGLANYDGRKNIARAQRLGEKQLKSQGVLDLPPSNDNGGAR